MKKIVIAGGSGFIGMHLAQFFKVKGYQVVILTRKPDYHNNGITFKNWDGQHLGEWVSALEGAETLINLSGRSVDCRYTEKNKAEILNSRILPTRILGKAIATLKHAPQLWINASTATIYKHSMYKAMTESNGDIGNDFSMRVAQAWEKEFFKCHTPQTRKVATRVSLVLGANDGVYPVLKKLAQFGLGGYHGNGQQKFAWIHIQDLLQVFDFIIQNDAITGAINCTSPYPLTNKEFMSALRNSLNIPFGIPTPTILLHIGAFFLRTEPELILKSRFVYPEKLLESGFEFRHAYIHRTLEELLLH